MSRRMTGTSENPSSNVTKFDLEDRTALFGENIIEFVKTLPHNTINKVLIKQIVRS